jgi:hypothetical protein
MDGEENYWVKLHYATMLFVYLKYAPIVSVDVKHSFLSYKTLLIDNHWK